MPLFRRVKVEKLRAKGDIDGLLEAFVHPDDGIRSDAYLALCDLVFESRLESGSGSPVVSALVAFAKDASHPVGNRRQAMHVLEDASDARSLDVLVELLGEETADDSGNPFSSIRATAIEALGNRAEEGAIDPLLAELDEARDEDSLTGQVHAALVKLMNEGDPIGRLAERGNVDGLIALLTSVPVGSDETAQKFQELRATAATALGRLGDERALPALRKSAGSLGYSHPVLEALAALGDIGAVVKVLKRSSPEDESHWSAASVLADHGNNAGRRALASALVPKVAHGEDYRARRGAAFELAGLSGAEEYLGEWVLPDLRRALKDRRVFGSNVSWTDEFDSDWDREGEAAAIEAVKDVLRRMGSPQALRILEEFAWR